MRTSRRSFLRLASIAGSALVIELHWRTTHGAEAPEVTSFQPSARLRLDANGAITLTLGRSEMGQGVRTSLPMILAEELEIDPDRLTLVQAEPGPEFQDMKTSGTGSVLLGFAPLARLGAVARETLIDAAAALRAVDRTKLRAAAGRVLCDDPAFALDYAELVATASTLPLATVPAPKRPPAFRVLGKPRLRVDGPALVDGRARFGIDVVVPGMRFATVARCPVLGGSLDTFDATAALKVPGVTHVFPIDSGVAVVATDTHAAFEGRRALRIAWNDGEHADFDDATVARAFDEALTRPSIVVADSGDVDAAFASAARVLDAVYDTPFQTHGPVEPPNCVADVHDDHCIVRVSTQAPNQVQEAVAKQLGLPLSAVRVQVELIGGGFGRRLLFEYVEEAVAISRHVRAPIKTLWDRADDLAHGSFHAASRHALSAALDADGTPTAWRHTVAKPSLLTSLLRQRPPGLAEFECSGAGDQPYRFPAARVGYAETPTHLQLGPWRGVNHVPNVFAVESFVDEIAHACGGDPLEFRLAHLHPNDPLRAVLRLAAARAGWGEDLPPGHGRGIACAFFPPGTSVAQIADVHADGDRVRVDRIVCAVDCGLVVNPLGLAGQIESAIAFGLSATLHGKITFARGRVRETSFDEFRVVRMDEMPRVEVHVVDSERVPSGMGEPPVPPVAPAVCNAWFAATGRRVRSLPIE